MGRNILVGLFVVLWTTCGRGESDREFYHWRSLENGGVNALYLYLRINGNLCVYSNLLRLQSQETTVPANSAFMLAHLAKRCGMPLRPRALTMMELDACNKPALTHLDGATPEEGTFILVLSTTTNNIYLVNGPTATIESMARESFKRSWSGIVLLPDSRYKLSGLLVCLFGFCSGLLITLRARNRGMRKSMCNY